MLPAAAAGTDGKIYVNDSSSPVSGDLSSLYAISGAGDTGKLGSSKVYAMTSTGMEEISSSSVTRPPIDDDGSQWTDDLIPYSTVKVGLYYGSNALTEARLENAVGSGYLFGYYDSSRTFHEVGSTSVTQLTMVGDKNITTSSGNTIGCYHILLSGSYGSFSEAKAAADAVGGFPACYSGTYYALYGNYTSADSAAAALASTGLSGSVYSASSRCVVVTQTGTDRILFEFDYGSSFSLAIRPVSSSGKAVTWFKGYKYYGDFQYSRLNDNEYLTVVNFVDIEDYTKGVLPYEMSGDWPLEALKAQALTARTYVASHFNQYRSFGFDVTNDTYSQVYRGLNLATAATNAAVDATAGQYIWYHGHLCETFFFSSDGGSTESSLNVWGTELEYLQGVYDPYEAQVDTGSNSWTVTLTPAQVQSKINAKFSDCSLGPVAAITPVYSETENVIQLTFTDTSGRSYTVKRTNCYYALDLKSLHFTVEKNASGNFVINGGGWGHNCGMSQWGAYSMAKNHGMTASQIIKFYYYGVYIR